MSSSNNHQAAAAAAAAAAPAPPPAQQNQQQKSSTTDRVIDSKYTFSLYFIFVPKQACIYSGFGVVSSSSSSFKKSLI